MEKQENGQSVTNCKNYKGEGEGFFVRKVMASLKTFDCVGGTITSTDQTPFNNEKNVHV